MRASLDCEPMAAGQILSATYAMGTVCAWGVADFIGGYTARRFHAFLLASLGHFSGTLLVAAIALEQQEPLPSLSELRWAILAGAAGGLSLAVFYRALSRGAMGLAAPLAAVLSAVVPAAFGVITQGRPGTLKIFGFVLALLAIWLISLPQQGIRPKGLALAVVSGLGFGLFYIFMDQAGGGSALWLATASRCSALLLSSLITLWGRKFSPSYPLGFLLALLAGPIDVTGTVLFVRAAQTGPLATAVILSSLYPIVTVLLAWIFLKEHFSGTKAVGVMAALAAVPMIVSG